MVCRSRVQPFFSGRNVEKTRESGENRAHAICSKEKWIIITGINTAFHILYNHQATLSCNYSYHLIQVV